jgi:hypothetical protein
MIYDMYFLSYFWYDIFPYILTTIQSRPNYIIQIIDEILVEKTIMNLKQTIIISRGVPVARLKLTGLISTPSFGASTGFFLYSK